MAFIAVTSLMRTLELQFLNPHPRVILSNKDQINSLHEKLGNLLVFLEGCEMKATNCPEMKEVTERIKEVSVEAEDDIEEELLKFHLKDETLQRVVQDVEELMQMTRNINHLVNDNNPTIITGSSQRTSIVEDPMVGHSEKLHEVMSTLLDNSLKQHLVMAMVGMGGIGKTTVVKTIYDDPTVISHFDIRAWTTMSQEHNTRQALLDLCRCVMPMSSNMEGDLEVGYLKEQLRKSLSGQRYLVVVDDIWTTEAWDDIQGCFPEDNNGNRILLTTRSGEIAQYANSGEYSYNMPFLNQDEGWNLFCQKFLDKGLLSNNEFETIGKNIVQKCSGLPLSIVVLAGLLSTINKSVYEWKKVEATINSLLTLNLDEKILRILTLSYNNLPIHLKGCFLYLAVFPEDCDISVKKLIRLWIAEGFLRTMSHSKSVEEVGGDYLQDLIRRSLVMVHGRSFDGKIKTCRMHDLLRELCVRKTKKENLLYLETGDSSHGSNWPVELGDKPWLSLKLVNPYGHRFHLVGSSHGLKCRSIICFNMVPTCAREWYFYTNSFKKLRVLDLSKINFEEGMPPDITDLVFLRYLAIASSMVLDGIPLWKNWNLQTLLVTEDDNGGRRLPPGIWDLPQLRHLEIYHQVSLDLPKEVRENLQTLYWLSNSQCTMEVLQRIPNVKELGIIKGHEALPLNNLCCLNFLEKLRIQGSYHPLQLLPYADIFPQNLKKLTILRTRIPWEAMTIISRLPKLEVLKLRNYACVGQEWKLIEEGGFPQLKVLLISLTNLKEWKADVDSPFPKLKRLLLRNCFELKEMPEWIEDIETLKLIKLEYCYASLVRSAQKIKQEKLDYGNDKFDVLDSHTRSDEDREDEAVPHGLPRVWFEARKLWIFPSEDPESRWIWTRDSESGHEIAELREVSWFQIRLIFDIRCLCKMTCYSAYLVFKLVRRVYLDVYTALASVSYEVDKGEWGWLRGENHHSQVFLAKKKFYGDYGQFPNTLFDGWMEIKLGDFYVSTGNEGEVALQLWHTTNQYWKSGFVVKGIEIRPTN